MSTEWTDSLVRHLLVMAYMSGWADCDTNMIDRMDCFAESKERARLAILLKSSEIYE